MAIETIVDPRTKKKMILANGVVKAVYFNEIKAEHREDYGKDGKSWIPTHRISLQVDDNKIQAGMVAQEEGKELKLRAKSGENEKEWLDVVKGAEVSIEVREKGEYKGVKQYECFAKNILVTKAAPEGSQTQSQTPAQKADPIELIAGNARNTAAILVARFGVDFDEAISYAAAVAHNAKIEYAATNEKLSQYQIGVSVGEAIKVAAELVKEMADMPDYITDYLANRVPFSLAVVKDLKDNKEYVTPELPAEAGKAKPAKPKEDTKPSLEDLDDDIPF